MNQPVPVAPAPPWMADNSVDQPGATCPSCGYGFGPSERFCPHCGRERAPVTAPGDQARRRLGGQAWSPAGGGVLAPQAVAVASPAEPVRRRRKKRRQRWYRRRRLMIPLTLLLIVGVIAGAGLYRAQSTLSSVQTVSEIPPRVTDGTVDESPGPAPRAAPVEFDTAPAQAALRDAGVLPAGDGGLFGRVQDATGDVGALAEGAAVAAGVKDPATEAITILVMGVDARPGAPIDIGVRPDALMVLHLDPVSGSCRGLAVPRDTLVELPGYGESKINHALMVGGIAYQKLVTEQFLGIPIDHYALIDFAGFQELVDAVGGVPVTVPSEITSGDTVLFAAGPQVFTGEQALGYARYRGERDLDVGRVRRQQQIIRGLLQVAGGRNVASDVNALLPALANHIRTDLSPADLIALGDTYRVNCGDGSLLLDQLQGDLVEPGTLDPLFQQELAYVVVEPAVVEEKVTGLLRGE